VIPHRNPIEEEEEAELWAASFHFSQAATRPFRLHDCQDCRETLHGALWHSQTILPSAI